MKRTWHTRVFANHLTKIFHVGVYQMRVWTIELPAGVCVHVDNPHEMLQVLCCTDSGM